MYNYTENTLEVSARVDLSLWERTRLFAGAVLASSYVNCLFQIQYAYAVKGNYQSLKVNNAH